MLSSLFPSTESLPSDAEIVIVGCGASTLIPMYIKETHWPHRIFTDPTSRLYSILGMTRNLSRSPTTPAYIHHSLFSAVIKGIFQSLKRISAGDAWKAGDVYQVGGEFLFEINTEGNGNEHEHENELSDIGARVTWCHRMKNTTDHSEAPVIRRILGLESG